MTTAAQKTVIWDECTGCGRKFRILVKRSEYKRFLDGEYVFRAFPNITEDEREILVAGLCMRCYRSRMEDSDDE